MSRRLLIIASAMSVMVAVLTVTALVSRSAPRHATASTPKALQPTTAGCTPVELQPGYPGYRGFVTGLHGPGEAACLEELAQLYPTFDREQEDAENVAAARRLGLAGEPSSWVWENWLAIEAGRGLVPACYGAAYVAMQTTPFQRATVPANDVRLRVGNIEGQELVGRAATASDVSSGPLLRLFATDYQLRAVGWVVSGKRHANALQIEAGIAQAVQQLYTPGGGSWRFSPLIPVQGGYAPVPDDACPDDQVFLATVTMAADAVFLPGPFLSAYLHQLEALAEAWRAEVYKGSEQPLRDYLAERMDLS